MGVLPCTREPHPFSPKGHGSDFNHRAGSAALRQAAARAPALPRGAGRALGLSMRGGAWPLECRGLGKGVPGEVRLGLELSKRRRPYTRSTRFEFR